MKQLTVNGTPFQAVRLLGKGKGGYSFLVRSQTSPQSEYVLKQIHHEPCSYYRFGDKVQAEIQAYRQLREMGIRMPVLFDVDVDHERILKEYIDGPTIYELVLEDRMRPEYLEQVRAMAAQVAHRRINLDYFPTNFIVRDGRIHYIDFECNEYADEWNFDNWGVKYWSKTPEFLAYVEEHPVAPDGR